jgi:hypothetical protein
MSVFIIIIGGLFPIYVLDYDVSPMRAGMQVLVLFLVLVLAWRATRGAWLALRMLCVAVGYGCANAGFLFAVAGIRGGSDAVLYYAWPILVAGVAAFLASTIWFARLTVPQDTRVVLRVQK